MQISDSTVLVALLVLAGTSLTGFFTLIAPSFTEWNKYLIEALKERKKKATESSELAAELKGKDSENSYVRFTSDLTVAKLKKNAVKRSLALLPPVVSLVYIYYYMPELTRGFVFLTAFSVGLFVLLFLLIVLTLLLDVVIFGSEILLNLSHITTDTIKLIVKVLEKRKLIGNISEAKSLPETEKHLDAPKM